MAPWSLWGFGLSLAFQARLLAQLHSRNERIRGASVSERSRTGGWLGPAQGDENRRVFDRSVVGMLFLTVNRRSGVMAGLSPVSALRW